MGCSSQPPPPAQRGEQAVRYGGLAASLYGVSLHEGIGTLMPHRSVPVGWSTLQ
jgi:hypothetical protein